MTTLFKPTMVNILGIEYSITYVDSPADVDIHRRESLWGQIDYWTRTIRIYDKDRPMEDVWESILHEVLHGVAVALHINILTATENHDQLDIIALALTDVFCRNGWIKRES